MKSRRTREEVACAGFFHIVRVGIASADAFDPTARCVAHAYRDAIRRSEAAAIRQGDAAGPCAVSVGASGGRYRVSRDFMRLAAKAVAAVRTIPAQVSAPAAGKAAR